MGARRELLKSMCSQNRKTMLNREGASFLTISARPPPGSAKHLKTKYEPCPSLTHSLWRGDNLGVTQERSRGLVLE